MVVEERAILRCEKCIGKQHNCLNLYSNRVCQKEEQRGNRHRGFDFEVHHLF